MERIDTINIGEILRKARENCGFTQEEVAEKLNLGRDAIIRIEKGTRKVTVEEMQQLVKIYSLNIEDILFDNFETSIENMKGIIINA